MEPRRRLLAFSVCWGAVVATLFAADVRVTPLVADGSVFASFVAPDTYTAEMREAVQSGLPTTLTFAVDLRRTAVIWFDRTIASVTVASEIKYDTLTRTFQVSKLNAGKVVWSDRTDKEAQMRDWATAFERVKLSSGEALEANGEYYVRVRVRSSPRRTFFFWPWGRDDAAGRADFTFIR